MNRDRKGRCTEMGNVANITAEAFPKQGKCIGRNVLVFFHYDTSRQLRGKLVRDDAEDPGVGIIALEDGRYVLTTECQYGIVREKA
jgi:hypothetical protein